MINPYAIIAVVATVIGLASWGALETRHANSLERQVGALESQHAADAAALKTTNASLDTALDAARQWRQTCTESAGKARLAEQKSAELQQQLDARRRSFARSQEKDLALPACQRLMAMDLALACPDVVSELRQLPTR